MLCTSCSDTHQRPLSGNAQIPPIYTQAFNTVDALGSGTISIHALQRVVAASGIPAATIEQVRVPNQPPPGHSFHNSCCT
jgi:sorting nexin-8